MLLGCPRQTVDLTFNNLKAPEPTDHITKRTAVAPDFDADCPIWRKFLDEATAGDWELQRFLRQIAGYCLTGLTKEHALFFVYGPGGNGKSVFVNVLTGIMSDYAATAAMDTFQVSHGDRHTTDLAMLSGARLVTASETEEGRAWAEARVKQMTGADPISARFMYRDNFTYTPEFKLIVIGNHKPILRNVDEAMRRRFNIIPFLHKPEHPDKNLETKLKDEWPAILAWMIEGCRDWQENGLIRPQVVRDATDQYFTDQDIMGQWLDDRCDQASYLESPAKDLFQSWERYAEECGIPPGTSKRFGDNLSKRGFDRTKGRGRRMWSGLSLKPENKHDFD